MACLLTSVSPSPRLLSVCVRASNSEDQICRGLQVGGCVSRRIPLCVCVCVWRPVVPLDVRSPLVPFNSKSFLPSFLPAFHEIQGVKFFDPPPGCIRICE